ncbi:hypothetical protein GH714_040473 [Hevea brasiliensis]|uniref:Bulb-type lectin domain-containing protein n=1 Tax=Hevea brasiliensis TaxID=3981 RepID=A0A6A6LA36_HEVBR|nr:hypothetical protein GH714_040473 [Hevea brasiliensis]
MEAVLLDEGNLVLRDGSSSSEPLWQSFDHPTDTWLPGVKIRLNKVTGEQYWKSGRWNGELFDVDPEMGMKYIDNITCVDNDKESYITYSLYNSSIFSRFVMDVGGQIQQTSWLEPAGQWSLFWEQPSWPCQVYARCGAFGVCTMIFVPLCHCLAGFVPNFADEWKSEVYSGGCKRNATLHRGVHLVWRSRVLQQLADFDFTGSTLYVRIAASEFSSSKNSKGIVWGVVASFGVTAVALIGIVLFSPWEGSVEKLLHSAAVKNGFRLTRVVSEVSFF